MVSSLSILGATGSVGRQAVAAAQRLRIPVKALAARHNARLLEEQARALRPEFVALYDTDAAAALKTALRDTSIQVGSGEEGLIQAAVWGDTDCVVTAVSGAVGLGPTLAAIYQGKRIALANKETLVCAGRLVMERARERYAEIIPVDSEHSAIFQCLAGRDAGELKRILLTASGGPFRGWSRAEMAAVTPAQAVAHPNWSMGAKISVDSATMMNKGLELIEAMHLFACGPEKISVLIHPESVVHSAVELTDGAVIAQLGTADMGLPIQYALTYPERAPGAAAPLDLTALAGLHFSKPDLAAFPCLALAMRAAETGGTAPAVLNAANEEAVARFLQGKLGFNAIFECVASALDSIEIVKEPSLEDILAADTAAREHVRRGW